MPNKARKIGLVLGSGSARGMSHIGVIRALEQMGIVPDLVVGCSVGALVGASYLNGKLSDLEHWALGLNKRAIASYFDLNFSRRGFVKMERMQAFYEEYVCPPHTLFSQLNKPFAAVACDLGSGEEIWIKKGQVLNALWASMAFPGLYPVVPRDGRWLVDGGLVNPVPVSVAKGMGAELVIAVNLNADIAKAHQLDQPIIEEDEKHNERPDEQAESLGDNSDDNSGDYSGDNPGETLIDKAKRNIQSVASSWQSPKKNPVNVQPKTLDVLTGSINIMQDRITRSRLVGEPPDIILSPRLSHIGLLELNKAKDAIAEGEASVQRMAEEIQYRLNQ